MRTAKQGLRLNGLTHRDRVLEDPQDTLEVSLSLAQPKLAYALNAGQRDTHSAGISPGQVFLSAP